MSTYSTGRSTQAPFHPDATDAHCSMYMDLTLCQRTATPQIENVVEATAGGSGLPPGRTRAAPNVQHWAEPVALLSAMTTEQDGPMGY